MLLGHVRCALLAPLDKSASCADPEGGGDRESGPPLKNHKNIGFLSNTGLDYLKITKLSNQHSMLGHYWHTSETPS